jgi:hypothetical protein
MQTHDINVVMLLHLRIVKSCEPRSLTANVGATSKRRATLLRTCKHTASWAAYLQRRCDSRIQITSCRRLERFYNSSCRHRSTVGCTIRTVWWLRCTRPLSAAEASLGSKARLRLCRCLCLLPLQHHLLGVAGKASVACPCNGSLRSAVLGRSVVCACHLTS